MAAEQEIYSPDALPEQEPRYLRRQKPVEIRRRKIGQGAWRVYARNLLIGAGVIAGGVGVYATRQFLLYSPRFVLSDLNAIEITGNQYVPREAILEKFAADQGRSVLRIPLGERREALEAISWVQRAAVQRTLPNRIAVALVERVPVAFLRLDTELALVDADGVILERPLQGPFAFPVVTGVTEMMTLPDRARRMKLYSAFVSQVEDSRPGAAKQVSEVDLSDESDLRATLSGMPELGDPATGGQAAVLVHFGSGDFRSKFQVFVENIGQWRADAGRVESVDLRFDRQVVVNPEARPAPLAKR